MFLKSRIRNLEKKALPNIQENIKIVLCKNKNPKGKVIKETVTEHGDMRFVLKLVDDTK